MICYTRNSLRGPITVQGVKPHKKTGIYWLRMRTPAHLVAQREELEKLGVNFRVEHHRSLDTRDPKVAARAHGRYAREIEDIWRSWEKLLEDGPQDLSYRNVVALAGGHARQFFDRHEDDPFDAPPSAQAAIPNGLLDDIRGVMVTASPEEAEALRHDLADTLLKVGTDPDATLSSIYHLADKHPLFRRAFAMPFKKMFNEMVGGQTDELLRDRGLTVTEEARDRINLELVRFMARADEGLRKRQEGDWSEVAGLQAIPAFLPSTSVTVVGEERHSRWRPVGELTFDDIIAEQTRLSDLRLDKQVKSAETLRKYRQDCERFAEWRGSRNALTVSYQEVSRWRDAMLSEERKDDLRNKTVINRITAVRAVLNWAISHNKRRLREGEAVAPIFPKGNPLVGLDLPEKQAVDSEDRTLSMKQAGLLLAATRKEVKPHLRWVQWLLSYGGMRIGEACQLEKRDVMEYGGHWYLYIRHDGERTTKTRKSRRVPLHRAIIAEGFLEFVREAPDGRLFVQNGPKYVREWAHEVVEQHGGFDGKPPLHGSRHLFADIATGHVELAARYYIEGRALPGSGKDYGRSAAMVPELSRMLNNIPPIIPLAKNEGAN